MLFLNLFILLDTVLQVLQQVLLYHLQCIFFFVAGKSFGLFLKKLFFDLSNLILLALHISARNFIVNYCELFLLDFKRDLNMLFLDLCFDPFPQCFLSFGVVLLFFGLSLFQVFVIYLFFGCLEGSLIG
jgi:hypothetical protein